MVGLLVGCSDSGHSTMPTMSMSANAANASNQDFDSVATGVTREYFIEAVKVDWNYAPAGQNIISGKNFTPDESVFAGARQGAGLTYKKCVYRAFKDATFTNKVAQPAYMGLLGPTIYAEVGDRVTIHYKNSCSFGNTIHVHGFQYDKGNEGSPYEDGNTHKADDSVSPGSSYDYHYTVPPTAGPGAAEGSTAMWMYHSHMDEIGDVYAGLTGFIVVTRHGEARADGTPRDVDQMVFSLFEIFDENLSTLAADNFRGVKSHDRDSEEFRESNLKHAINGFIYGNGAMPTLKQGSRVRWFLMDMGNEVDLHTPHWHGNTAQVMGMRTDVVSMLPGTMVTADLSTSNPGIWLFHCHVADHIAAGMVGRYQVVKN